MENVHPQNDDQPLSMSNEVWQDNRLQYHDGRPKRISFEYKLPAKPTKEDAVPLQIVPSTKYQNGAVASNDTTIYGSRSPKLPPRMLALTPYPTVSFAEEIINGGTKQTKHCQKLQPPRITATARAIIALKSRCPAFLETYTVENKLGEGAFGVVFKCRRIDTKRAFAVKLPVGSRSHQDGRTYSRQELDIFFGMKHNNVVRVRNAFIEENGSGNIIIVFDLARRGDLWQYVQSDIEFHVKIMARGIFRQVVLGLQYIHSRGYIHSDLKPCNILIFDRQGNGAPHVRISDFGNSRKMEAGKVSIFSCTKGWSPPEACGAPIISIAGKPADAWSLGCVGYFILTGGWQPFLTNQVDLPYGGEIWRNYESNMRNGWIKWPIETSDTQITNEAKWLIHTLLDLEPQNRPTLGECLKHLQDSWVEHGSDLDNGPFWGGVPKRDQNTMPRRWPQLPPQPRPRSPPPPTPRLYAHHEFPSEQIELENPKVLSLDYPNPLLPVQTESRTYVPAQPYFQNEETSTPPHSTVPNTNISRPQS